MRYDARAMDRRWLVPLVIGGGALVLVAVFMLLSGGEMPMTTSNDDAATSSIDATAAVDTRPPDWMTSSGAPPPPTTNETGATAPPPPTAPPNALLGDAMIVEAAPLDTSGIGSNPSEPTNVTHTQQEVISLMKQHVEATEANIKKLESQGKHDEAEKQRKALQRLQAELDAIVDGGTP